MAKKDKEVCPVCGSDKVAKATDKSGRIYCQKSGCMHVWSQDNAQAMKRPDVMIQKLQLENQALLAEVHKLRKENESMKALIQKQKPVQEEDNTIEMAPREKKSTTDDEIFT